MATVLASGNISVIFVTKTEQQRNKCIKMCTDHAKCIHCKKERFNHCFDTILQVNVW